MPLRYIKRKKGDKMKPEDVPKLCSWDEEKEEWHCNKCGSVILGQEQIVSLHMPPRSGMPLAGFGETVRKIIPYCPKCEPKPRDTGISYYGSEDDPDIRDLEIIKRIREKL